MGVQSTQEGIAVSDLEWAKFAANLVVIIGGLGALYLAFKRWVKDVSKDTKSIDKKVNTKNGHTIGEQVDSLTDEFADLRTIVDQNSLLINEVLKWRDEHVRGHP